MRFVSAPSGRSIIEALDATPLHFERGVKWEESLERYGDWTRDAVLYLAVRHGRYGLSEVYQRIPGLKYQAAAQGVKRIAERRERDRECDSFLRRLADQL